VDRQTRRLFLAALAVVAIAAAVVALTSGGPVTNRPVGPAVDGVAIQVESSGIGSVAGFTLRTADGRQLRFGLGQLGNPTQFAPGHLAEHVATSQPIRVWYRETAGGLEALWLEDVPAGTRPT